MVTLEKVEASHSLDGRLSGPAYRSELASVFARNFKPWGTVSPLEWAENVAKVLFSFAPYQREMFLELFEAMNQEVIFMIFSRGGKSKVILTALGYCIAQLPQRILAMWPTLGQAEKWSKDDLMEFVNAVDCLAEMIGDGAGRRVASNTILHKLFPGGLLDIVGANAPGDLRRAKGSFLYADEIDAIVETATDEGDQLAIFKKRGSEFPNTIEAYASYPSLKGKSRIEAKEAESDGRRWMSTCLLCGGEPYIMHRSQLLYDPEKPELARLECPRCKGQLTDLHRYEMMMGGDSAHPRYDLWRPTRPFRGKAGFQANAMLWPHPVNPAKFPGGFLQVVAQQAIDAEKSDNPERSRRVMINTLDAETYEAACDVKPDKDKIYLRREAYDPREMLPARVLLITLGGDIQKDRGEFFLLGWGERAQSWGIDHWVIKGSPIDLSFWEEVEKRITNASWQHPCGERLKIACGLIDCGYQRDEVIKFTRPLSRLRVFASFGSTQLNRVIVGKPSRQGKPPTKVFELGTHAAKEIIYQRLDHDNPAAYGFKHYPKIAAFDETYFRQLLIENSEMRRAGDGEWYRFFSKEEGDRNEAIDGEVYALAAERIIRAGRKEAQFYAPLALKYAVQDDGEEPGAAAPAKPKPTPPAPRKFVTARKGFATKWRR
jgi:phage terminase large subunit GpA-like protein